jgi:hypothetical protein
MTLNNGRTIANHGKAMHSKDKVKRNLAGDWLSSKVSSSSGDKGTCCVLQRHGRSRRWEETRVVKLRKIRHQGLGNSFLAR